jgi:heat shock protein HslJ
MFTSDPANPAVVEEPDQYTVTFLSNGTANVHALCNDLSWTYTVADSSLHFTEPDGSMLALNGQDDLGLEYLPALGQAISWTLTGDILTLELPDEGGSLESIDSRTASDD